MAASSLGLESRAAVVYLAQNSTGRKKDAASANIMADKTRPGNSPTPFTVHLSKIQVWMPTPIHALATHPDGRTLAVGREDGDIELTVPAEGYRVESRVPGLKGKGLRSLVWLEGENVEGDSSGGAQHEPARLFGCGLDGTVFEVDLVRLSYQYVRDAYGGAAWCMRAASSLALLAVGCEDGSVRLFTAEGGGLEYKKTFPSTGSRVLSLAWGAGDDMIFAGCADSLIHCFDASSGQSLFDMRLERKAQEAHVLVWALESLTDGTVVSGDSCGRVQVWDGLAGTQLQSLTTHEADVLCLCVTEGQTEVYASGCDGKVVLLEKGSPLAADTDDGDEMNGASNAASRRPRQEWEWSVGRMVRIHTHDVQALAICRPSVEGMSASKGVRKARQGHVLVSGGLDTSLSLYSIPGFKTLGPRSLEPLPPVPVAFLARTPRLVLVMHNLHLDVWKIPKHPRVSTSDRLSKWEGDENDGPQLVLRMEPKSEKGGHLSCAALAPDGGIIAVSNTRATKVYRIGKPASPGGQLSVKRVRLPGDCTPPAHVLSFTADGRTLVIATAGGDIRIVDLGGNSKRGDRDGTEAPVDLGSGARLVHCFEEHVDGVRSGGSSVSRDEGAVPIWAVTLSVCGKWMTSASASGVVHVFDLTTLRHHWTLPSFSPHRCVGLRFHCRHAVLACVDSSNAFRLFDVPKRRLAECHDHVTFPKPPLGRGTWGGEGNVHPLSGVTFNPEDQTHSMLLFNHRSVMYVTPGRRVPESVLVEPRLTISPPSKKSRLSEGGEGSDETRIIATHSHKSQSNFKMKQDFRSVVLLDFLAENEVLVMENPWESVRESLPNALDRKQYGV